MFANRDGFSCRVWVCDFTIVRKVSKLGKGGSKGSQGRPVNAWSIRLEKADFGLQVGVLNHSGGEAVANFAEEIIAQERKTRSIGKNPE